jgi:hypothetical protein
MTPTHTPSAAIAYVLAAFGFAYVVGMSAITADVRVRLMEWAWEETGLDGQHGFRTRPRRLVEFLLDLMQCPACFGTWTGFVVGLYVFEDLSTAATLALITCTTNGLLANFSGLRRQSVEFNLSEDVRGQVMEVGAELAQALGGSDGGKGGGRGSSGGGGASSGAAEGAASSQASSGAAPTPYSGTAPTPYTARTTDRWDRSSCTNCGGTFCICVCAECTHPSTCPACTTRPACTAHARPTPEPPDGR